MARNKHPEDDEPENLDNQEDQDETHEHRGRKMMKRIRKKEANLLKNIPVVGADGKSG
jgi:hypothetical protein